MLCVVHSADMPPRGNSQSAVVFRVLENKTKGKTVSSVNDAKQLWFS